MIWHHEYTKEEKKKEKETTAESGGTIRTDTYNTVRTETVGAVCAKAADADSTNCQKEIF